MKIKAYILFLIIILLINNIIFPKDQNFTYSNKKIGVGVVLPDKWELYTNEENAHDYFKKYFTDNKSPNESPLFLGMRNDRQLFIRLLFEKYNDSIDNYIKTFYFINQNNISFHSIKKHENSVILIFTSNINNIDFKYYEAIIKHNELIIQLGFWTLEMLFDENIKEIKEIAEKIALRDFSKLKLWINPLKDIDTLFVDANYDFLKKNIEEKKHVTSKEEIKGIFYEVKGKNNKVFLMGSVHIGRPDFYPLAQKIEEAFEQTKNIVVEINLNNEQIENKTNSLLNTALLSDNKTLDMILPEKLYKEIEDLFLSTGLSMDKFNRYEPWFLNIIIESLQYIKAGYLDKYGIDKYFLNKSMQNKNIIELETFDAQIETLKKIDYQKQLAYTLLFFKTSNIKIEELMNAWKTGDDKKLEEIIFSKSYNPVENFDNLYKNLFYNRNENFVNQISNFLDKDENYFNRSWSSYRR